MWPPDQAWRAPVGDFPPLWASAWGDDPYGLWADLTVNGITQRMRWIEPSGPGGFLMGASREERDAIKDKDFRDWAHRHEPEPKAVGIEEGFWLADTPCTQAFWLAVMGHTPIEYKEERIGEPLPVSQVNWREVEQFFLRFASTTEWICADRLVLPTEEEWEYAARAGSTTAYWWGNEADSSKANWNNEHGTTTTVKRYAANPWGLFDVHGNVWEWCADSRLEDLDSPAVKIDTESRVVRGGSWNFGPGQARSSYRNSVSKRERYFWCGFRFALRSSSHQGAEPQWGTVPGGPAR